MGKDKKDKDELKPYRDDLDYGVRTGLVIQSGFDKSGEILYSLTDKGKKYMEEKLRSLRGELNERKETEEKEEQ